jgi:hypothetical protein
MTVTSAVVPNSNLGCDFREPGDWSSVISRLIWVQLSHRRQAPPGPLFDAPRRVIVFNLHHFDMEKGADYEERKTPVEHSSH